MHNIVDSRIDQFFKECVSPQTRAFVACQEAIVKSELLVVLQSDLISTVRVMMNQYRLLVRYFTTPQSPQLDYPSPEPDFKLPTGSVLPGLLESLLEADDIALLRSQGLQDELLRALFQSAQSVMSALVRQKRWAIALAYVNKAEKEKKLGHQRIIGINDDGICVCEYISEPNDTDHAAIERLLTVHEARNETIFRIGSKPNRVL